MSPVLHRFDEERRALARDGETLEILPHVTRLRAGDQHSVIYSALTDQTADDAIAAEVDHHRRLNVPFEWKAFGHDAPADLLDRLRRRGFSIGPVEAVLIFDLAAPAPDWLRDPPPHDVRRVDTLDDVATYRHLVQTLYDKEYAFIATDLAAAIRAGSTQHRGYLAYAGAEPVSLARLYTHPDSHFAGLYGGATHPAYRHQGYYRALIAARARDAIAAGARYLQVDAMPTSRPILERLGFQRLTETWPCTWTP